MLMTERDGVLLREKAREAPDYIALWNRSGSGHALSIEVLFFCEQIQEFFCGSVPSGETDKGGAVVTALCKSEEALEAVESRAEIRPLFLPLIDFIKVCRAREHLTGKFLQWA